MQADTNSTSYHEKIFIDNTTNKQRLVLPDSYNILTYIDDVTWSNGMSMC